MQPENISFILERLQYLGFGGKLGIPEKLIEAIREDPADITLVADMFIEDMCRMEVTLYFQRSEQKMTYFFNRYMAKIFYLDNASANRGQMFNIFKGRGVTLKEAYNLLQGRSVNKEMHDDDGTPYTAWIQLDFDVMTPSGNYRIQKYRESYGYDLERTLEKYPIRELLVENLKQSMLRSLKKGNLHPITMLKGNKIEQWLLEAVPRFKTIKLYPVGEGAAEYAAAGNDHTALVGSLANVAEPPMPWDPEPPDGGGGGAGEDDEEEEAEGSQELTGGPTDKDQTDQTDEEDDIEEDQPSEKKEDKKKVVSKANGPKRPRKPVRAR